MDISPVRHLESIAALRTSPDAPQRATQGCERHSRRVVSGLKTGTQPDLAPETDDPICVMREGKPPVGGAGRGLLSECGWD